MFLIDGSHSLKTPVAVIASISDMNAMKIRIASNVSFKK